MCCLLGYFIGCHLTDTPNIQVLNLKLIYLPDLCRYGPIADRI